MLRLIGTNRWACYVRQITGGATCREIGIKSDITESALSRWLGDNPPQKPAAQQAIRLARAYGRPPLEALIAAGYLEQSDAEAVLPAPITEFSDKELLGELARRLRERAAVIDAGSVAVATSPYPSAPSD